MNRKHRHQHNYEVVENQSLTVEQINKLRKVYTFFDKDEKAKGRLVASDLFALMKELGISHSFGMDKCKEVINIYASTTEGMSFEDFLIFYCQNSKNCSEEEELRRVFRLLDDNGDGYVEIGKLRHIIETLQPSLFKVCNLDDVYRQNASLRKSSFVEGYRKGLMSYQDFVRFLNE